MKVVSIGGDRSIFEKGSATRERARHYAARLGEMHVVVFAQRSQEFKEVHEGALHIYPTNSFAKLMYVFDAARIARRLPGEVVTTQDPFEAGLAGVLARNGRPLHVQLHTDPFAKEFAQGLNVARHVIAQIVLKHAAHIRAVSRHVAEELSRRYPDTPISILPIFVDVEKYRQVEKRPHPRFKTTLLWVGRFEKEKNPALALEALAALPPEAGLVMLGVGRLEQELRDLVKKRGIQDRVEFAGWQEPAEFLGLADLLLVTSKYEGYGRQIIEALAAGVPVLSTDVGVAREAGAIVTTERDLISALEKWLINGEREVVLKDYPYSNFEEYIEKYCADLEATIGK